jgi:16S rRNA (cytosine967-C5)-methyltransferase
VTTRDAVLVRLTADGFMARALDLTPDAVRLDGEARLRDHPLLRSGEVEVQDAGSQAVGRLAGALPGERVADVCAGAGGKTLLLAAAMRDDGEIAAFDVDGARLGRLRSRAGRAGVRIVRTAARDGRAGFPEDEAGGYDRVLVDAPCSGLGTWRRQPEQRWRLTPERLEELCRLQAALIGAASSLVRPGGRLVYATCSLLRAENETPVTEFLDAHPGFRPVPAAEAVADAGISAGVGPGWGIRLSPRSHGVDGFFAAVMERAVG